MENNPSFHPKGPKVSMESAARANGQEDNLSFVDLVQRLSALHENQQENLRQLSEQNNLLRQRLANAEHLEKSANKSHSVTFFPPEVAQKVRPLLPDEALDVDEDLDKGSSHFSDVSEMSRRNASSPLVVPDLWPEWVVPTGELLQYWVKSAPARLLCAIDDSTGQTMTVASRCQGFMVRPNSLIRLIWDLMSSLLVFYDVVSIPLMALSLVKHDILGGGTGAFTEVMDLLTTVFWTLDIPCSFVTGFHTDGAIEMRPRRIAKHYLSTWFTFDFVVVVIDWAIFYISMTGRSAHALGLFRIGKSVRMARILRTVRLLRFVKLQRVIFEALEKITSETIKTGLNIFMAVAFIFVINHYLACGWFLIGHFGWSMDAPNWIEPNKIQEGTVGYAYATSLHWAMTQFTPAGMEIRPYNVAERVYSIMCLVFALITFSSFLGSITSSITSLRKHTTDSGRQQLRLRTYLAKNKVSPGLARHIWTYLQEKHFNHQTRGNKSQLEVLELLPPHLFGALHMELYGPYITRAPFFYQYTAFCRQGVMEVCSHAVAELSLVCGDLLFSSGKLAKQMFFTYSGYMKYEHAYAMHQHVLGPGSWASEPVLWVKWAHVATMVASTSCEILAIDSAKFRTTMGAFLHSLAFVRVYAQLFHEHLVEVGPCGQSDVLADIRSLESLTKDAWRKVARLSTEEARSSGIKDIPDLYPPSRLQRASRFSGFWQGGIVGTRYRRRPPQEEAEPWWKRWKSGTCQPPTRGLWATSASM